MWRGIAFAAAMLWLCACSKSGSDGGPDGPCSGLSCSAGIGCMHSGECRQDAGYECVQGVCANPCVDSTGCAANEVCGPFNGTSYCFHECANGACPTDAGCATEWTTGHDVCSNALFRDACTSVVDEASCSTCNLEQYTEPCDGELCPASSVCQPLSPEEFACVCGAGVAYSCDGTPCDGADPSVCPGGHWTCRAPQGVTSTCTDEQLPAAGHCVCADGRMLPFVCGETSSCEHRCSEGCDLIAQDCTNPTTKCSPAEDAGILLQPGAVHRERITCVPLSGQKMLGDDCTSTTLGYDDCDKGLFCTATASVDGGAFCRTLCNDNSQCSTGLCARIIVSLPPAGVCVEGCTLRSTDCGALRSCTFITDVNAVDQGHCKTDGTGAFGDACMHDRECGPDLGCAGGNCRASCSAQVACDAGTCELLDTDDTKLQGFCY